MTRGVDAGQVRDAELGDHRVLKLAWTAVLENHVRIETADALLVAVQFVSLNGRESGREHAVVERRFEQCMPAISGSSPARTPLAHTGPRVEQVNVIGDAAAKIAVLHLPIIDVPEDKLFSRAQAVQPAGRPTTERRQVARAAEMANPSGPIQRGVLAAESVVWIDA